MICMLFYGEVQQKAQRGWDEAGSVTAVRGSSEELPEEIRLGLKVKLMGAC